MAIDAASVFLNTSEHAESVIYETPDGTQSTISAVVDRQPVTEETNNGGRTQRMLARISASRASVASPSLRDTFTFDSTTWAVNQILSLDVAMVVIEVQARNAIEVSKRDYRGGR